MSGIIKVNMPVGLAVADNRHYRIPRHIEMINNKLIDVALGKCPRLLINMPPRHGKSELVSKYFPTWYLLNNPDKRVMLTSYSADLAKGWGRVAKNLIYEYGEQYGINLLTDSRASHRFTLNRGGELNTAGVGGAITGKGADILIVDDPVKNIAEALSKNTRQSVWDWFTSTAYTRLEPGGAIIVVMTRWHYDDLGGRILLNGEEWYVLNLPAINEYSLALWPERFTLEQLLKIKEVIGTRMFSSLYQQQPLASEDQIFKPHYWNYYNDLPKFDLVFQSWDTAVKANETNDFSVCTTFGMYRDKLYILDIYKERLEFPELLKQVLYNAEKHKVHTVLIEDKSSGQGLIQTLVRDTQLNIKAVPVKTDKVVRANLFVPFIESGRVLLPNTDTFPATTKWVTEAKKELEEFPVGAHDDIVDSITQSREMMSNIIIPKLNISKQSRYFNI